MVDTSKKRKSLTDEVQEKLMDMIRDKSVFVDSCLPSEAELSEMFKVSRTTTRSAVGSLVEKGLLERVHGKGIYIADNTTSATVESLRLFMLSENYTIREFLETREILEPQNAFYAAYRANDDDILFLQECIDKMNSCGGKYNEEYSYHDISFHMGIAKASKNKLLIAFYEAIQPLLNKIIDYVVVTGGQLEADFGLHQDILDKIIKKDPEGAADRMLYNMSTSKNTLLSNLNPDTSVYEITK